ncbi:RHS repeat-associated core domain-containing protein [Azospirillum sp. B4]|uniref:RHS repeat-associated core domain-containing protein n=1 Tax=Azospirillum sp. B4 TaxID=95605 RepID=UPI00034BB0C2|nr:RHS repeat-associated core domain-containing protein [Azospirillum sp. B4]
MLGTAKDVTWAFTYNQARQITNTDISNPGYLPTLSAVSNTYGVNGLNQLTDVNSAGLGYDRNGNLTSGSGWTFGYDAVNRLISSGAPGISSSYVYDPQGHRIAKTANGTPTSYLYDGPNLVAEYDAGGNLLRRYVFGPGVDEPLVVYTGGGTGTKQWFYRNWQGSVVGLGESNGEILPSNTYSYGPYGEPGTTNTSSLFRYTGQVYDPETGLYHYKARAYSPALGRFLQTDPVGYKDNMNIYTYTQNDPVNFLDSNGRELVPVYVNGGNSKQYNEILKYMSGTSEFRENFSQLSKSEKKYVVRIDPKIRDGYDPDNRTIIVNPTQGLKLKDGSIQSPAMGAGHEFDHAARDDADHGQYMQDRQNEKLGSFFQNEDGIEVLVGSSAESIDEVKALDAEGRMANKLHEPTRKSHKDGEFITVPSPTTSCISTVNALPCK